MSGIVAEATKAAHSLAAGLLSKAQILPGASLGIQHFKENSAEKAGAVEFKGKNLIVGVPGAFTGTCSAQVPGYIKAYSDFKAKGVSDIFVVAVNDVFAMKAWKEHLAPEGTDIKFIADDTGAFTSSVGCLFDATPLLGGPRSKRYVIVTDNDKISSITVEANPGELTITDAKSILASL